jgi:hypothetical protein
MRNFIICIIYQDIIRQVKANEMGRACGTHGREEKSVQGFGGKARRKDITWKTKAYVRRWIRMDLREIGLGCVDWIRLAQDRNRWRTAVSAFMSIRVLVPRS